MIGFQRTSHNKSACGSVSWFVSSDPAAAGFKLWLVCLGGIFRFRSALKTLHEIDFNHLRERNKNEKKMLYGHFNCGEKFIENIS